MTARPLVSILVLTYNHERYIGESIQSALAQTYENFEVIVVDDGSTDKTPEIVAQFQNPRLRSFRQPNMGPSAALNWGISKARGTFFVPMSGDDLCEPQRLELQMDAIDSRPEIEAVFSHVMLIDENSILVDERFSPAPFNILSASTRMEFLQKFFWHGNFLCAPSALIRTESVRKIGGFKTGLFQLQDFDLWIRLLKIGKISVIPDKLVRYRVHSGSLSRLSRAAVNATENEMYHVMKDFFSSLSAQQILQICSNCQVAPAPVPSDSVPSSHADIDAQITAAMTFIKRESPVMIKIGTDHLFELMNSDVALKRLTEEFNFRPSDLWRLFKRARLYDFNEERDRIYAIYSKVRRFIPRPIRRLLVPPRN